MLSAVAHIRAAADAMQRTAPAIAALAVSHRLSVEHGRQGWLSMSTPPGGGYVTSVSSLASRRIRPGVDELHVAVVRGEREKRMYYIPIGADGLLGWEWIGFMEGEQLYLRQFDPGRCTWFAIVNGYQNVAPVKLSRLGLLNVYRMLMTNVKLPMGTSYHPDRELAWLYESLGGELHLLARNVETVEEGLERRRVVLLFEDDRERDVGGVRVVSRVGDARIRSSRVEVLNFFARAQRPTTTYTWEEFVDQYVRRHYMTVLDPHIVRQMIR